MDIKITTNNEIWDLHRTSLPSLVNVGEKIFLISTLTIRMVEDFKSVSTVKEVCFLKEVAPNSDGESKT